MLPASCNFAAGSIRESQAPKEVWSHCLHYYWMKTAYSLRVQEPVKKPVTKRMGQKQAAGFQGKVGVWNRTSKQEPAWVSPEAIHQRAQGYLGRGSGSGLGGQPGSSSSSVSGKPSALFHEHSALQKHAYQVT